jgi:hypothetical protein
MFWIVSLFRTLFLPLGLIVSIAKGIQRAQRKA